jgi:acetyltransferase-like isoleucine patch superfamily enzyme
LPRGRVAASKQEFDPKIVIGNRVTATGRLTLAAHAQITIEDDVLFAANVNLTDGLHGFEHADEPYKYQPIFRIAPIVIKRGCWIGQNVVIMPGVTIGELSIIGANSVVTQSIPARCIAVGAPARVIKKWDEATGRWVPEPL